MPWALLFLLHAAVSTGDYFWTHVGKPGFEESRGGTMWPECRHRSSTTSHQNGFSINVRCCHDDQSRGTTPRPCRNSKARTWDEAKAICEAQGAGWRLCTVDEYRAAKTARTGCGFDTKHAWTSDPCDTTDTCTLTYHMYADPMCTFKIYQFSVYTVMNFCALWRENTCESPNVMKMRSYISGMYGSSMCSAGRLMSEQIYTSGQCVCQSIGWMSVCYAYSFDCCPPDTCDSFSCGESGEPKEAPSLITCLDSGCDFETCCDYKCDKFICPYGTSKSQPENLFCDSSGCSFNTCCDLTCEGHVCTWGIAKDSVSTIFCTNNECDNTQCCDSNNPWCDSWTCQNGTQITNAGATECLTGSCSEDLCCVPACPDAQPSTGSSCSSYRNYKTCEYGTEYCCGANHHSYEAMCDNNTSTWGVLATDYCYFPPCYVTDRVQYVNDYQETIGDSKQDFLQSCNAQMAPVRCLDVTPGQLDTVVVLLAGEDLSTFGDTDTESIAEFGSLEACTPFGAGRSLCGNCVVDLGEACDDCNMNEHDACKTNCCPTL